MFSSTRSRAAWAMNWFRCRWSSFRMSLGVGDIVWLNQDEVGIECGCSCIPSWRRELHLEEGVVPVAHDHEVVIAWHLFFNTNYLFFIKFTDSSKRFQIYKVQTRNAYSFRFVYVHSLAWVLEANDISMIRSFADSILFFWNNAQNLLILYMRMSIEG